MALDLLRALRRRGKAEVDVVDALQAELASARGRHAGFDAFAATVVDELHEAADGDTDEAGARHLAARVALAAQASLLARHSTEPVFQAFCAARLAAHPESVFGVLPAGLDLDAIIERAMPETTEVA
jgi:putative acyl-CoA dehydrogenase